MVKRADGDAFAPDVATDVIADENKKGKSFIYLNHVLS